MQKRIFVILITLAIVVLLVFAIRWRVGQQGAGDRPERRPAAVRVEPIEIGALEARRTYSGSLEATAQFIVAPKIGGRIEELTVRIADDVKRGQIVARLDDAEHQQVVAGAEAEFAVAEANLMEARNALTTAERELGRVRTLRERGVSSESQFDAANASFLARQSQRVVAEAQLTRVQAALAAARIRLGYTQVSADWSDEDDGARVVAERYVNEGDTVSSNEPLFLIVELDPITAVIYVTERDYSRLRAGQRVGVRTDGFPDREFEGHVARVSPVFSATSRQARVEIEIPNLDRELKPGMFARATVVLDRVEQATILPRVALTRRGGEEGVFVLSPDRETVRWQPVRLGVTSDQSVQAVHEGEMGEWVVTLGQNLVEDGSRVRVPEGFEPAAGGGRATDR